MYVFPSELSNHRSPFDGLTGATVEIETDAPPPLPPPPAILISTVVPLTAKVFPVPMKFSVLTGPDVIEVPADEIPRLNPPVAVTIPVALIPDELIVTAEPTTAVAAVMIPETLSCLANNVSPVTVVIPAKVETPETTRLLVLTSVVPPIPVKFAPDPLKLVAVITPEAFIFVTLLIPDPPRSRLSPDWSS